MGIIVTLLVGAIAGWLAGKIYRGSGFGLIGDIIIGIIGSFIGGWLFTKLGVEIGTGMVSQIVSSTIGAIILLFVFGLFSKSKN